MSEDDDNQFSFYRESLNRSLMAALGNLRYIAVECKPIDWALNELL